MGEIKLKTGVRNVFGKPSIVTSKKTYSTIPSGLIIARISQTANIKPNTAKAAMLGIKEAIRYFVMNGHSVNLGALGYLKLGVNAGAVAQSKQVTADLVKKVTITYRPSQEIRTELANVKLSK